MEKIPARFILGLFGDSIMTAFDRQVFGEAFGREVFGGKSVHELNPWQKFRL